MVEVRGNETELVSVAEVLDLRGVVLWAHDSGVATVGLCGQGNAGDAAIWDCFVSKCNARCGEVEEGKDGCRRRVFMRRNRKCRVTSPRHAVEGTKKYVPEATNPNCNM